MSGPAWLKPDDRPDATHDDPTFNRVELVGYIGQDPEVRHTRRQELIVTVGLATHRLFRDGGGEVTQITDWHRVVAEGGLAEQAADLRRGALVKVVGRLRTRSWETRRGERRVRTEVLATEIRQVRRAPVFRQAPLPLASLSEAN
jgi:single-strand DNA-binding protein